ncbi:MAG: hypothetical protein ACREQF_09980 [Candidatus Binataceae bacterium]
MNEHSKWCIGLAAAAFALLPGNAFAYVDPGSGGLLLQLLFGGLVGLGIAVKYQWHRISRLWRRTPPTKPASKDPAAGNGVSAGG